MDGRVGHKRRDKARGTYGKQKPRRDDDFVPL